MQSQAEAAGDQTKSLQGIFIDRMEVANEAENSGRRQTRRHCCRSPKSHVIQDAKL